MNITNYLIIAFIFYGVLLLMSEITNQWYERTNYIRVFNSAIFWPVTLVIIIIVLIVNIRKLATQRKRQ